MLVLKRKRQSEYFTLVKKSADTPANLPSDEEIQKKRRNGFLKFDRINKLNDFLNLLVLENRKIILPLFRKIINVETKTDLSPVTEADKSTEKNIRSLIHKISPTTK